MRPPSQASLSDLLQPVPPCVSLRESVQVYKEHCRMAREFHQVKHDIAVLEDRKWVTTNKLYIAPHV